MYIQPIAGGKSRQSQELKKSAVVARAHVASPGIPQNVRDALKESASEEAKLVIAKT